VWLFDTTGWMHRQLAPATAQAGRNELTLKAAGQNCKTVDKRLLRPDGKRPDLHGEQLEDVVSLPRWVETIADAAARACRTQGAAG
jgi:hypothetical protein